MRATSISPRSRSRRRPAAKCRSGGIAGVGRGKGRGPDPAALQRFIRRFPESPLTVNAQQRLDVLQKAAQERDDRPARSGRQHARPRRDAAPGGTARGRTGGCEEAGHRAPRQGHGSRTEGESRRGRTQGSRSQAEGRAGQRGARRRRSGRTARRGRAAGQGGGSRTAGQGSGCRAQGHEDKRKAELEAAAARTASEKQATKRRARKLNSLSPGKLRARTNRPGSSRSRPRAVRDRASRI